MAQRDRNVPAAGWHMLGCCTVEFSAGLANVPSVLMSLHRAVDVC